MHVHDVTFSGLDVIIEHPDFCLAPVPMPSHQETSIVLSLADWILSPAH